MMIRLLAQILVLFGFLNGAAVVSAQTCAVPGLTGPVTLSAVPNSYYPGTANAAAGASSITVGTRTGIATNIAEGDLLLIIQMQGATIDSSNTNQYGDGAGSGAVEDNTGNPARGSTSSTAGQYEFAVATNAVGAGGGTLNLSAPLTYNYVNANASGTQGQQRFQVIRVPQYSSLTLSGTIDVTPWNGSSGGVFVVDVAGSLALGGATINGLGRGFRGGGGFQQNPLCTAGGGTAACTDYRVANANPANGAFKGEGIAGTPAFLWSTPNATLTGSATGADGYPNGDRARGAPGNAGGGGNQHNAGGGGGGNGGQGGFGGNSWNSSDANFEGQRYGGFGGAGGYNAATRIILGGGGGAGDIGGNTRTPDWAGSGGSGGAIVMIRAGTVSGNGTINVDGGPGIAPATGTDAGGGGGAGGTVWITTGNGTLPNTLNITANGGAGANSGPMGSAETDGPGGGGGGGQFITNATGASFTANGGIAGVMITSTSNVCGSASANPQCYATAGGAGLTTALTVPVAGTGVRLGHECLPDLRVTKATTTPLISAFGATTASYTINIQNFGGGARNVTVQDSTLPVSPNWTRNATAPSYLYSPALPIAANNLPAGGEASITDGGASFALVATPGAVPASGLNALTWRQFFLPPIKNGVPSSVTITFIADIPAAASVGCYHNAAGISFLDSTRLAAAPARTVTMATNNTANRTALAYAPNTTYASGFTTTIAGFNYSGLPNGSTGEDVCLQGNVSITKTAPASATAGQTLTYTLVATNAGRQISDLTFSANQATTVTNSVTSTAILSSAPLRITDTLPASLTVTTAFSGAGWVCSQVGQNLSCDRSLAAPITASAVIGTVTGIVRVSNSACPGPLLNTATVAGFQSPYSETNVGDNSSTVSTTLNCNANLSITKTNTVTSLVAGSTTSYLIGVTNTGPSSADGAVMSDVPSAGLSCTVTNCSASGGSPVASCPAPASWPNLLTAGGVAVPSLPSGGNVQFTVTCGVTATGL